MQIEDSEVLQPAERGRDVHERVVHQIVAREVQDGKLWHAPQHGAERSTDVVVHIARWPLPQRGEDAGKGEACECCGQRLRAESASQELQHGEAQGAVARKVELPHVRQPGKCWRREATRPRRKRQCATRQSVGELQRRQRWQPRAEAKQCAC